MRLLRNTLALALLAGSQASPLAGSPTSKNAKEPCALAREVWEGESGNKVPAQVAYECLKSIPVATKQDSALIDQLKLVWKWHSEVGNLKHIPPQLELESVDLLAELDSIKQKLPSFDSEYEVQLAIQNLTLRTGNFHFNYAPDILSVFTFLRPVQLASVSDDGKSLPKTYAAKDLEAKDNDDSVNISPVTMINGQDVEDYLLKVAAREQYLDSDSSYNSLMFKGYRGGVASLGAFSSWDVQGFYWGPTTDLTFANGSVKSFDNTAIVQDMEGVNDAKTFFAKFCTGKASENSGNESAMAQALPQMSKRAAIVEKYYPKPVVQDSKGAVAGYFMKDEAFSEVAVLKIITFLADDVSSDPSSSNKFYNEFQSVVKEFVHRCNEAGMKRLVIDLRENGGGSVQLLLDAFMQLFPTEQPHSVQNIRAHPAFKRIGEAWNAIYNNDELNDKYFDVLDKMDMEEPDLRFWYYDDFRDVDGQTFNSWEEYYGPHTMLGDSFTTPNRYNLSNSDRFSILDGNFNFTHAPASSQPFKPEDIVMLTDGMCGSACASFHESLKNIAGVQSVVVGGVPREGPMQPVGGSKGGEVIDITMVTDIATGAVALAEPLGLEGLKHPDLVQLANAEALLTRAGDGSSRIQIYNRLRVGDPSETPMEYIYEAADCRIFYTADTLLHPEAMWAAAWTANTDRTKCVKGSTMHPSSISGGYKFAGMWDLD